MLKNLQSRELLNPKETKGKPELLKERMTVSAQREGDGRRMEMTNRIVGVSL